MPWMMAAAVAGSSLLGAMSSDSASSAQSDSAANSARMQSDAANRAADLQNAQYQQARQDQQMQYTQGRMDQAPWLQAGQNALNQLGPLASNYKPFDMNTFQQDPGYAFRMAQGQQAINHSAAAAGGLQSGNALKAASDYGQASGSQEYQNAFNRYQAERAAQLQPLQSLAGVGQSTAQSLGAFGSNMANSLGQAGANSANAMGGYYTGGANNAANYMSQGANARAAGYMGGANAVSGGLSTYMNNQQSNNLISALRGNQQAPFNYASSYGGGSGLTNGDANFGSGLNFTSTY